MRLPREFYLKDDVRQVAKSLLGKKLMVRTNGRITGGMIVEAEAYSGAVDRASHAYKNKITERTRIMFEEGGRAYVYLCYGIHHLFNIVTNVKGTADAVLIRALQPLEGFKGVFNRRNALSQQVSLTNGPGKLSRALGIDLRHNGMDLLGDVIWIEEGNHTLSADQIVTTKRIGVDYAGPDADLPWRYYIRNNMWISKK